MEKEPCRYQIVCFAVRILLKITFWRLSSFVIKPHPQAHFGSNFGNCLEYELTLSMKKHSRFIWLTAIVLMVLLISFFVYSARDHKAKQFARTDRVENMPHMDTIKAMKPADPNLPDIEFPSDTGIVFPENGAIPADFVQVPYEIDEEVSGKLNEDGYEDVVLVLRHQKNQAGARAILVLMGQESGGFKLLTSSWKAVGPAANAHGYELITQLNINDDHRLTISYGAGQGYRIESTYRLYDQQLMLEKSNLYASGAGSSTEIEVNVQKRTVITRETDMTKDDMPTSEQIGKLKGHQQYDFAHTDPASFFN